MKRAGKTLSKSGGESGRRVSPWLEALAAGGAAAASIAYLFRSFLFTGGRFIAGDVGDARLYIVILEHWLAAARGLEPVRDPNFFAPFHGVLGYSDTLLLYVPVYAAGRALGLDPYLSFEFTLIGLKLLGFAALYVLLRGKLGLSMGPALGAASAFTLSNISVTTAGHPQLWAMVFVPVIAWLAMDYDESRKAGRIRRARWSLGGAGFVLGSVVFSSFYVGYFTILAAGAGAAAWWGLRMAGRLGARAPVDRGKTGRASAGQRRGQRPAGRASEGARPGPRRTAEAGSGVGVDWRGRAVDAVLGAAGLAVWALPMMAVYLPVLREMGGRDYREAFLFTRQWWEVFELGPWNAFWGGALERYYASHRTATLELGLGLAPLMTAVAVAATLVALARKPRRAWENSDGRLSTIIAVLGLASAALYLVTVRFGRHSLWVFAYLIVPGARAIRVPARMNCIITLALLVVCAAACERMRRAGHRLLALVILALLVGEQVNHLDIGQIDRWNEKANLAGMGAAPSGCTNFFVWRPRYEPTPVIGELDAMLLAARERIPTINGYSGWAPPGWDLNRFGADYGARVARYEIRHGLIAGACAADFGGRRWLGPAAANVILENALTLGPNGHATFAAGESGRVH